MHRTIYSFLCPMLCIGSLIWGEQKDKGCKGDMICISGVDTDEDVKEYVRQEIIRLYSKTASISQTIQSCISMNIKFSFRSFVCEIDTSL